MLILYVGFAIAAILEATLRSRVCHIIRKIINIILVIIFLLNLISPVFTHTYITATYVVNNCAGLVLWSAILQLT